MTGKSYTVAATNTRETCVKKVADMVYFKCIYSSPKELLDLQIYF